MSVETRNDGPRSAVFLKASLKTAHGDIAVTVRNYSTRGALIETGEDILLKPGDVGVFIRNRLEMGYRIVWVNGKNFGINFEGEVHTEQMLERLTGNENIIRVFMPQSPRRPALKPALAERKDIQKRGGIRK